MDSDEDLRTVKSTTDKHFFRWKHRFIHSKPLATALAWLTLFLTYTLHSSLGEIFFLHYILNVLKENAAQFLFKVFYASPNRVLRRTLNL